MKVKVSELTGAALNWAVSVCQGYTPFSDGISWIVDVAGQYQQLPNYSTDWAQGGPIIEREGIEVRKGNPLYFPQGNENGDFYEPLWIAGKHHGQTPLIAAMRCYVASKLGDTVDVPEELA